MTRKQTEYNFISCSIQQNFSSGPNGLDSFLKIVYCSFNFTKKKKEQPTIKSHSQIMSALHVSHRQWSVLVRLTVGFQSFLFPFIELGVWVLKWILTPGIITDLDLRSIHSSLRDQKSRFPTYTTSQHSGLVALDWDAQGGNSDFIFMRYTTTNEWIQHVITRPRTLKCNWISLTDLY